MAEISTVNHEITIRTLTLGINIREGFNSHVSDVEGLLREKLVPKMQKLHQVTREISFEEDVKVLNHRISLTPIASLNSSWSVEDYVNFGVTLDRLAIEAEADFIGGFSGFIERGINSNAQKLIEALPSTLRTTKRLCGFLNVASFSAGINMDAVKQSAQILKKVAEPADQVALESCARFAVSSNLVAGVPYMPNSFHSDAEHDFVLNIGMGGIENLNSKLLKCNENLSINDLCEIIKNEICRLTQKVEKIGLEIAKRIGASFGGMDISLSPLPNGKASSILELFRQIGVENLQTPGSLAVLAIINDSLKRGGMMGSSYVRGFSGTFISVSEDSEIFEYMKSNQLSIDRLLALTSICSIGLDMLAISAKTPTETIAGIIADEMAIGNACRKPSAVRLILSSTKQGEMIEFNSHSFLGRTLAIEVDRSDNKLFISRGGFVPPSMFGFTS